MVSCMLFGQLWLDRGRGGNAVSEYRPLDGWLLLTFAPELGAWVTCEEGGVSDMLEWEGKRQG